VWALKGETGSSFISWLGAAVGAEKPALVAPVAGKPQAASPRLNGRPEVSQVAPIVEPAEPPLPEERVEERPESPSVEPEGKSQGKAGLRDARHPRASERLEVGPVRQLQGEESPDLNEPLQSGPSKEPQRPENSMAGELRLYREAREVFLSGGDNGRALALWDRYLTEFPSGAFVPEARFNRAVCLLRLGQRSQAKMELEVFAKGSGYRKAEAEELLTGMAKSSSSEQ